MKICFTILLAGLAIVAVAQTPAANQGFDPEQNLRILGNLDPLSAGAIGFDNRYEGIKGSPFLFTDFQMGTIQFAKQDTFSTVFKLNLDLVKNTLLVQLRNGSLGEISANNLKALKFANIPGQTSQWIIASEKAVEGINSVRLKFYGAVYDGKSRLLKSVEKKFKKADYQGAYSSDRTYDEFLTNETYWLSVNGKPFEKVKMKRKDIEKTLADQANQVEKLVKEQKLNLNSESDIVQLLKLLDQSGE